MKRIFNILLIPVTILVLATGCKKSFNEMNINENKPTSAPASLLFNGVLNDMYDAPYSMYERWGQYY